MELIDIIIVFGSGFVLGWFWQAKRIIGKLVQDPQRTIDLIKKYQEEVEKEQKQSAIKDSIRSIRVEKHGSTLYLYAKDTDEFLAQGSTLQEALATIEKRFPNQDFKGLLSKEEADALGITVK